MKVNYYNKNINLEQTDSLVTETKIMVSLLQENNVRDDTAQRFSHDAEIDDLEAHQQPNE